MPKKKSKYVKGLTVDEAIVEACGENDIIGCGVWARKESVCQAQDP
jgi:hypothetical protein